MAGAQLIISITRKEGMSDEEFYKYWTEVHGPMFLDKVPLTRKYISKYEQYHHTSAERKQAVGSLASSGLAVESCDGVSVLSADSAEDLEKVLTSKEFLEVVGPDNGVYTSKMSSVLLTGNERVTMYERGK